MVILAISKVRQNFRVTLPKEVRKLLELEEDNELVFFTVEGFMRRVCFRKSV